MFQPLFFIIHREKDFSTKAVKRSTYDNHLENLVDHESPMLYTKIQPQSFLGSGEEDF